MREIETKINHILTSNYLPIWLEITQYYPTQKANELFTMAQNTARAQFMELYSHIKPRND